VSIQPALQCDVCKRRLNKPGYFCEAYKDKPIPEELVKQSFFHDIGFPGDQGILFIQDKTKQEPYRR